MQYRITKVSVHQVVWDQHFVPNVLTEFADREKIIAIAQQIVFPLPLLLLQLKNNLIVSRPAVPGGYFLMHVRIVAVFTKSAPKWKL